MTRRNHLLSLLMFQSRNNHPICVCALRTQPADGRVKRQPAQTLAIKVSPSFFHRGMPEIRFSVCLGLAVFLATVLFALNAQAEPVPPEQNDRWLITGRTMGPVPYSVVVSSPPSGVTRSEVESTIQGTLERVNQLMSTYRDDSDVSRFNRSNSTDWFSVDAETAKVISRAIEIHDLYDSAFDIRVASAVNRWNFGPDRKSFELPSEDEIAKLNRLSSDGELVARLDPPAVRKSVSRLRIDLSAIAKGYAVDQVVAALTELKCQHAMVEVGGEVYAMGFRDAREQPWRIGIERPSNKTREILAKVPLHNQALATSGDYRNYFTHNGKHYSHTIDPATSRPVEHFLASSTIIADDCMTADALATAVMVVGAEAGHKLAIDKGFPLLTVDRLNGFDGELVVQSSETFPLMKESSEKRTGKAAATAASNSASIWPTFLAALLVFSIAIVGMAVGAIFANKPVTGSCGGMSAMAGSDDDGQSICGVCSKPTADCDQENASEISGKV